MKFQLRFWGVRGSYPTWGKNQTIGGCTTCVEMDFGKINLIFDAGTGIIRLGKEILKKMVTQKLKELDLFIFHSHYHQDHTQGLPFFAPIYNPRVKIHFFGPGLGGFTHRENLKMSMFNPFFPVNFEDTGSKKEYYQINENLAVIFDLTQEPITPIIRDKHIELENLNEPEKVKVLIYKNFTHPNGGSFYYVVYYQNKKVVFATDIEGFVGGDVRLIGASKNADYLIHDTQYTPEVYTNPFFPTQGFGHSTPEMSTLVAKQAGVKNLILTHHDPDSDDAQVEKIQQLCQEHFPQSFYAYEVMEVDVLKGEVKRFL